MNKREKRERKAQCERKRNARKTRKRENARCEPRDARRDARYRSVPSIYMQGDNKHKTRRDKKTRANKRQVTQDLRQEMR